MIIGNLIIYLSVIVWLLPPLKQFRGRFFYYFLILALSDPIGMTMHYFRIAYPITMFVILSAALLLSLPLSNDRHIKIHYAIPILALSLVLMYYLPFTDLMLVIGIIHLLILLVLFKYLINYVLLNGRLQLFHLLIVTYETSMMLKFTDRAFAFRTGKFEFYFISGFEIILGVMFSLIKEESPRLSLKFR